MDANAPKIHPCGEAFAIVFGGNFEASLILVEALWDEHLNHLVPNGFISPFQTEIFLRSATRNPVPASRSFGGSSQESKAEITRLPRPFTAAMRPLELGGHTQTDSRRDGITGQCA